MNRQAATLAIAVAAFLGYYALPEAHRAWAYYVASGVLLTVLGLQYRGVQAGFGAFVGTYIALEGALQAACGSMAWALDFGATDTDVCVAIGGGEVMAALLALIASALITWGAQWPNRRQQK